MSFIYSTAPLAFIKVSLNSSGVAEVFNYSLKFFPKFIILVKFYNALGKLPIKFSRSSKFVISSN